MFLIESLGLSYDFNFLVLLSISKLETLSSIIGTFGEGSNRGLLSSILFIICFWSSIEIAGSGLLGISANLV